MKLLGAIIVGVGFFISASAQQSGSSMPAPQQKPAIARRPVRTNTVTMVATRLAMKSCLDLVPLNNVDASTFLDVIIDRSVLCIIDAAGRYNKALLAAKDLLYDFNTDTSDNQQLSQVTPTTPVTQPSVIDIVPPPVIQHQPVPSVVSPTNQTPGYMGGESEAFDPNYRGGLHFRDAFSSCMNEAGPEGGAAAQRIRTALNQNMMPAWGMFGGSIANKIAECEGRAGGGNYGGMGSGMISGSMAGEVSKEWKDKDGKTIGWSQVFSSVVADKSFMDKVQNLIKDCSAVTYSDGGNRSNPYAFGIPTSCSNNSTYFSGMGGGINYGRGLTDGTIGYSSTACNNNSRCEYGESSGSCPSDCGSGSTTGFYSSGGSGTYSGGTPYTAPQRACMIAAGIPDSVINDMELMRTAPGTVMDDARRKAMGDYGSKASACFSVASAPRAFLFGNVIDTLRGWFSRP